MKLKIEVLDDHGKAVASTDTYNESAESLAVPDLDPKQVLASGKVKPVPPGGEERFRGSFLSDETPPFTDYRVTVVETPAAAGGGSGRGRCGSPSASSRPSPRGTSR